MARNVLCKMCKFSKKPTTITDILNFCKGLFLLAYPVGAPNADTRVINAPFWMRRQKSAYLTEYLTNYRTDLHQCFSVGRNMYDDHKTYISFVVVQGTLLW